MHYLSICCIAKEEGPFLKEWLAYHAQRGVEHFYIYDNMSETPIREVLGGFADGRMVTIRRVPGKGIQVPVYDDCLRSFGAGSRWMGFIDLDEFIYPVEDGDVRVFLSEFESYAGVAATWRLFNSSGHLKRPQGLVLENYTEAFVRQNSFHCKCLVNPARTLAALSPHHFQMNKGAYCVNEDHYPVSPWRQFSFAEGRRIRINHYFVRSQQDFEEKLRRGRADTTDADLTHDMGMFLSALEKAHVRDTGIQRYVPELREALRTGVLPRPPMPLPGDCSFSALLEAAMAFLEAGQPEKCLACLCRGRPEFRNEAEFWTLRSMAASMAGNIPRAEIFLREAMRRECARTTYVQLERLLRLKGNATLADEVAEKMRCSPEEFS